MTDTSKEATNSAWVNDACELFDQHAQELGWQRHIYSDNIRALLSERDALRAQLQAARDGALEEAAYQAQHACLVPPDGGSPTEEEVIVCDEAAKRIRALKSTSAEGEG